MGAESMNDDAPSRQAVSKRAWTSEENDKLVETVQKYGPQRWSLIATHLPGRVAKQCRERWFNHCCPEVSKGDWTEEEDRIIAQGVAELGTKWSAIVKRLPGRTDNAIKNRYNSQKRRDLRAFKRGDSDSLANSTVEPHEQKPTFKRARQEASVCQQGSTDDSTYCDGSISEDEFSERQQRKRQRQHVIDLATKLAAGNSVDDRQGLMQQLMDVTMQYTQSISSNTCHLLCRSTSMLPNRLAARGPMSLGNWTWSKASTSSSATVASAPTARSAATNPASGAAAVIARTMATSS